MTWPTLSLGSDSMPGKDLPRDTGSVQVTTGRNIQAACRKAPGVSTVGARPWLGGSCRMVTGAFLRTNPRMPASRTQKDLKMPEILTPGIPPQRKVHSVKCHNCGCRFNFRADEDGVRNSYDRLNDARQLGIDCPQEGCSSATVWVKP